MQRGYKTLKNLAVRRKTLGIRRILSVLRTYFIRYTHQASVHCDFIRLKKFWTAQNLLNRWTFRRLQVSICIMYEQQMIYARYNSLNVCNTRFASSWVPLNLHPLPLKTERGGQISYMERLFIDISTDIERWKRMDLVIIVFIPCVYVRRTWYICFIRSASALSAMRLLLNCVHTPDNPFGIIILFYPLHPSSFRYSSV